MREILDVIEKEQSEHEDVPLDIAGDEAIDEDAEIIKPLTPKQAATRAQKQQNISNRQSEENLRHQAKMKTLADQRRNT